MIALIIAVALSANPTIGKPAELSVQPRLQTATYVAEAPAPVLAGVAVTLECTAHTDGKVSDCAVLGETHPGLGFGAAAIALMNGSDVAPVPSDIQFARTIQFTP